jgi:hypothetical protein
MMKGAGRLMAATRGERRSSAWERSPKKITMDPPKAGEVKIDAAELPEKRGRELGGHVRRRERKRVAREEKKEEGWQPLDRKEGNRIKF